MTSRHSNILRLASIQDRRLQNYQEKMRLLTNKAYQKYRPVLRKLGEAENNLKDVLFAVEKQIQKDLDPIFDQILLDVEAYLENYALLYPDIIDLKQPAASKSSFNEALDSVYTNQVNLILTGLRVGRSNEELFGDGNSVAMFGAGLLTRFLSDVFTSAFSASLLKSKWEKEVYVKQAIAAIDRRTTDCCLRVHMQVQPIDKDFRLTGTPRYSDRKEWSPFHNWCRTTIVVIDKKDVDNDLNLSERSKTERFL